MDKLTFWAFLVLISLVGACGNILWKVASNHIGQVSLAKLLDLPWDVRTLFTPVVFIALTLMFVSRFASIVPTGYMQITQIMTAITVLSLTFTVVLDSIFLKPEYPPDVWIGIVIGIISIFFMTRGLG